MIDSKDYAGREQAYVKHVVLQRYLQALALKVGQHIRGTTLNYVDGFSGPWDDGRALNELHSTSPYIALKELCRAKRQLQSRGIGFKVRGLFVERDRDAYARLQGLLSRWTDAETESLCGRFEDHVGHAAAFAATGDNHFAFIFIDPTGWKGFGLQRIASLVTVQPSEVLVNFMLKDILRFVDDDRQEIQEGFEELFGERAEGFRARWRGLSGLDREDAIVREYCDRLRHVGEFAHCVSAIVLNPTSDRTHYHLVYATRSLHGLLAFREAERVAMEEQENIRAATKQAKRIGVHGQRELFSGKVLDSAFSSGLEVRYAAEARSAVLKRLETVGEAVCYEELLSIGLRSPMVYEQMLKAWLVELAKKGEIRILGLNTGERVPKIGRDHRVQRFQ